MSPEEVTRALTVFDAFLAYSRSASARAAAHPPLTDVATATTSVRGGSPVADAATDEVSDSEVTRITSAPLVDAEKTTPRGADWEEPTHERPDVMRALARSDAAQPDTDVSIKLPKADPRVEQASIIIEDDSLTEPEFRREDVLRAMAEHARAKAEDTAAVALPPEPGPSVDEFAVEMQVLVKWGHAGQAAGEIERWLLARPGDAEVLAPVSRAASRAARRE